MELPQVEIKPVTATVIVVRHFRPLDQLRGLPVDVENVARIWAASRADREVRTVLDLVSGGKAGGPEEGGCAGSGGELGGLDELETSKEVVSEGMSADRRGFSATWSDDWTDETSSVSMLVPEVADTASLDCLLVMTQSC
jgi:hypothetical protein